ncbi:hypothetical protein MAMMFC1_01660 [Methylomusa anaerophila]|uniref:Uncharacterized protein n=1 Tax=Methylomusa anaerophila TaxID=1930071 RepID=A0A348AIU5_9FIRM|nr:hypothetical protein MAMMFC1_01660 [Methylomusa anaerophila]
MGKFTESRRLVEAGNAYMLSTLRADGDEPYGHVR